MGKYEPTGIGDELRPLYEYWDQARGERSMPARAVIDPLKIPRDILANIFLLEVHYAPLRFRYRLIGTAVVEMLGEDWTGKFVDELNKANPKVAAQYVETVDKREPTEFLNEYSKLIPTHRGTRLMRYRRLLLPFSEDDEIVDMLMGATAITAID